MLVHSDVGAVYVVDSFGSLYSEQIRALYNMFFDYCKDTSIEIGIHAHNNRQLAFANTIEAVALGGQLCGREFCWLGPRRGQLSDGAFVGLFAQPEIPLAPGAQVH